VILAGCGGSRGGAVVVGEMHRSWDDLIELLQPTGYCMRAGRACCVLGGQSDLWRSRRSQTVDADGAALRQTADSGVLDPQCYS
jgi:hypothetical protein